MHHFKNAATSQLSKTQKREVEKGSTITANALSDNFILQTENDHWLTFVRDHEWLDVQIINRASWEDEDYEAQGGQVPACSGQSPVRAHAQQKRWRVVMPALLAPSRSLSFVFSLYLFRLVSPAPSPSHPGAPHFVALR